MALFSRRAAKPLSVAPPAAHRAAPGSARDEARVHALGAELLSLARGHRSSALSAKFYSDALMEWSMKDPSFKVQMFRFVDAFPTLKNPESVYDHLQDYLSQPGVTVPGVISAAMAAGSVAKSLAVKTISSQITAMASKFIAGRDAASALQQLRKLWDQQIAFSVDLLGEACVSDAESLAYQNKYLDLVGNLPGLVAPWPASDVLERDHLGPIPRVNVSIKISSLSARCDPIETEGSIRELMDRLQPILTLAQQRGVFINFDMEQFALKDLTIQLFQKCCEQIPFSAGLAMQAYLRSGDDDARRVAEWAKKTGRVVTVRLVKGAYWDYETINADQMGWPQPVWPTKRQTDACFERMAEIFLDAAPRSPGEGGVKLALGSHNARSIAAALEALERRGLPRNAIELQMLHGMADQLKGAARELSGGPLRVREYVPVGEMLPGMAYLVRRLLENTSNESWLKAGFLDNADASLLLASPHSAPTAAPAGAGAADSRAARARRHALTPAVPRVGDEAPFINEPFREFHRADVRAAFARAVESARVPRVENDRTPAHAADMVARAAAFFPRWRDVDVRERAAALIRAAAALRDRRDELAAVMILEAGKTWREADADVCEAIDFCEYYARLAVPLFEPRRLGRFTGEIDTQFHQPRGVAAVISPWNFPLAICCGMTVAALVTGNTVVVKPAEQTPGIAQLMCDILWNAGVPREALHFCPAPGETTGAALVRDPRVALIAFTGSMAVGLDILSAAAPPSPFAPNFALPPRVKHVVCEMGGKNAVIIDESADLDEAVLGVRHSAFGFQGQKCSACSRVIVVGTDESHFVERLVESTRALVVGDPSRPGTDVGPVIDPQAAEKIRSFIDRAAGAASLALASPVPAPFQQGPPPGSRLAPSLRWIAPHIFTGVAPDSELWREEVFGPVLAVTRAATFEEALRLANDSPYKLTGGVFSRKPANLARAVREFRVGNLYLNRGITGALVGRQPFGGFGMSGTGSKAGGLDYLLHFVEPRAVCENAMRRGFAPEEVAL
ncbi:MAG: proline dehydrogenase family protein [Planctomycetota bacterium]|nr:proline dehydrogenase family protein [Planctomycetota bacterium]